MVKKIINTIKNISTWIKIIIGIVIISAIGSYAFLSQTTSGADKQSAPPLTISLQRTTLAKTMSASGVVESANTCNIYSTQNYPVQEIYVSLGDRVKAGDILAKLDMSKLKNDIAQAELNLKNAQNSAAEDKRSQANSITNAQISLEMSRLSLERQMLNTANAESDLKKAEADTEKPFDSYIHDKAIEDAKINLQRRTDELKTSEKDLQKALGEDFDNYTYKNTLSDAEKNYDRKRDDEELAYQNYYNALNRYHNTQSEADWNSLQNAQTALNTAIRAVEDAETALDRAKKNLTRAESDFSLDNPAVISAEGSLIKAQNNLTDAQRSYERALSDKERAIQDYLDSNTTKLKSMQKSYADSQNQLQSAQISLESAQNSLEQAIGRSVSSNTSVELQLLNLERLNSQLAEGMIIAAADGVVTEINAKVGAVPNGILFVIEDVDNLYVSANVKEYSLSELQLGQRCYVTTEATANMVYDAELTYISPKAVSPAGSTSVEFEIKAKMNNTNPGVKIGMNAFLNIISAMKSDIYAVPLSAVVTIGRESFVYIYENDERKALAVSVGLKTSTQAEITGDGLRDGLMIVILPDDTGAGGSVTVPSGNMPSFPGMPGGTRPGGGGTGGGGPPRGMSGGN